MAYFMNSLKINNEYHVTTLCKITREDETHFFARPLKRDNFIRLINVTFIATSGQHSHFVDEFEDLEIHVEINMKKTNNWGDYAWKFIDTKYNFDDLYFIEKELYTGYRSCLFSMNLQLYKQMYDITELTMKIDKHKLEVIQKQKKGENCETPLYNIDFNTKKVNKMIKTISDIKL